MQLIGGVCEETSDILSLSFHTCKMGFLSHTPIFLTHLDCDTKNKQTKQNINNNNKTQVSGNVE